MSAQSHFVVNEAIKLHHLDWGNQDSDAIVLLHGARLHARVWDDFSRRFRGRFHILALDHRGHGDSGWSNEYQFEDFYRDLRAVIRARRLSRFTLIGHSLGGRVAMLYTHRHPTEVQSLVLVDIAAGRPAAIRNSRVTENTKIPTLQEFATVETAIAYVKQRMSLGSPLLIEESVRHGIKRTDNGCYTWKYDPALLRHPRGALDFENMVKSIAAPTLLQYGSASKIVGPELAARMAAAMPHCSVERIEHAGHALFTDQPEVFAASVERFLNSIYS